MGRSAARRADAEFDADARAIDTEFEFGTLISLPLHRLPWLSEGDGMYKRRKLPELLLHVSVLVFAIDLM
jgi:hypothetical protein